FGIKLSLLLYDTVVYFYSSIKYIFYICIIITYDQFIVDTVIVQFIHVFYKIIMFIAGCYIKKNDLLVIACQFNNFVQMFFQCFELIYFTQVYIFYFLIDKFK